MKYRACFAVLVLSLSLVTTLPASYASEDAAYVEVTDSKILPKIDGKFTTESEWSDASVTSFESNGNNFHLLTKQDRKYVYFMFDGVDFQTDPQNKDLSVRYQTTVCFDVNNDKGDKRQPGDFCYVSTINNEFGEFKKGEFRPQKFDSDGKSSHLDLLGWAFRAAWGFDGQNDEFEQADHLIHEMRVPKNFLQFSDVGFTFEVYFDSANDDLVQLVNGATWPSETDKETPSKWGTLHLPSISCVEDLELVIKTSTGEPSCVKSESKEKLVQRGWAKSV